MDKHHILFVLLFNYKYNKWSIKLYFNTLTEVTEPPYFVSESGYAGFNLPIDIYFKNKEDPRMIRFDYDLFLRMDDSPPVNHTRCEKLTFQNPTEEFKRKLLKAGGVGFYATHKLPACCSR